MADHNSDGRDPNSNPPRVSDIEDERWEGEGGGMRPSQHGAGNDSRDHPHDNSPPSLDEGDPESTSDSSGTSKTD